MDENQFTNILMGKLEWVAEGMYYRFEPNNLPIQYIPSNKVQQQVTRTASVLGELKGRSREFSPQEVKLFQQMFMVKEATLSSEIEGTRATMGDVLRGKKIIEQDKEKREDIVEINNYSKALEIVLQSNTELNVTLLESLHRILLTGARGATKGPGEFKVYQNGIGNREDTLDTAKFVPASPQTTPALINNLMMFMNSKEYEPLYKIAISHYQFETIHPFRDGNGRLGRLLVMAQLCREDFLGYPIIYISEYFNRNRDTYTEKLFNVSAKGEVEDWVLFFLKGLEYQAAQSIRILNELLNYKTHLQEITHELSKSPNMHILIDSLFRSPYFDIEDVQNILKITQPAARSLVIRLVELGVVEEQHPLVKSRRKLYAARKILNIIENS